MKFLLLFLCLPLLSFGQIFKGESVVYDAVAHRFLTSDDGTSIVQRAGDGTISYFGSGLKAKYGMEIMQGRLFALTTSTLYAYDLSTATQLAAIPIPGAGFLNGLASDGVSRLWATDFNAGKIYQIEVSSLQQPVVTTLVASYGGTPNGIVYDAANNRLVVVSWGSNAPIKAVDLATQAVSTLVTTSLTNIDGIDKDGQGNFYIASWSPDRITRYTPDFASAVTIPVVGLNNPADICYATTTDTLAIPNTGANNILFVGFTPISATQTEPGELPIRFSVWPNPLTDESQLLCTSLYSGQAQVYLYNAAGALVFESAFPLMADAENKLPLRGFRAGPGLYTCVLRMGRHSISQQLVKY